MVAAVALRLVVEIGQAAEFPAAVAGGDPFSAGEQACSGGFGLDAGAVSASCVDQGLEALEGRVPLGQLIGVLYPLHVKTLPVAQGTSMANWRRAKKVRFLSSWHAKSGKHEPCQAQCLSAFAG